MAVLLTHKILRPACLWLPLLLGACAMHPATTRVVPQPKPAAATPPVPQPAPSTAAEAEFRSFVHDFRQTALAQGIAPSLYDLAMGGLSPNAKILSLNEAQPEFVKPVWDYLATATSPLRVRNGQNALAGQEQALSAIEARYGVSRYILTAIWGMETNYGSNIGSFNIFQALATLAYDGPRTGYARPQLLDALKMAQQGGFAPSQMPSSWAGAFGQTQFTPSTWLAHAVDFDGDGRKDLWRSVPDALASSANLLSEEGWAQGEPWGIEVRLPDGFSYEDADIDIFKPVAEWRARGVRTVLGEPLPQTPQTGALFLPAGSRGPAFLVYNNFKVLLRYNNASAYALAVGILADRIAGKGEVVGDWPRDEQPLTRDERLRFQRDLNQLGFNAGKEDGVLGRQVRAALRAYQKEKALPADGFATKALLERMDGELASPK